MEYNKIIDKLAEYASVVSKSYKECHYANSRKDYEHHLSFIGEFLAAIHDKAKLDDLLKLVELERRNYGWEFLPGEEGDKATKAWVEFYEYLNNIK